MRRLFYIIYYIKNTNYSSLNKFSKFVAKNGKNRILQFFDIILCSLKYNISFLEYYYFRFWEKNSKERSHWAGTGFMFEYQLKMNPKQHRNILENKVKFLQEYKNFVRHKWAYIDKLKNDKQVAVTLLANPSGKIVLKGINEQCGKGIKIVNTPQTPSDTNKLAINEQCFEQNKDQSNQINSTAELINIMQTHNLGLAEEYIVQHDKLNHLSPAGLNTVRVFTQINSKGTVDFLGARLRITVNSFVDNLAAGNLAAPIDMETGKITKPAIYSDITKKPEENHPITKSPIVGFEIPHWGEIKQLCVQAALHNTNNKSIGWDVAVSNNFVELLEGNHNWCKLLWQLPVNKGMKKTLEKYCLEQ